MIRVTEGAETGSDVIIQSGFIESLNFKIVRSPSARECGGTLKLSVLRSNEDVCLSLHVCVCLSM